VKLAVVARGLPVGARIAVRQALRFLRAELPRILTTPCDVLSPRMVRVIEDLARGTDEALVWRSMTAVTRVKHVSPKGITLEPDGHMVADKRADISAAMPGRKILCELKRDYHADLWIAADQQLERFYAHDSEAKGFGIYGVLWFGHKRPSPIPHVNHKQHVAWCYDHGYANYATKDGFCGGAGGKLIKAGL
jgi:hypothetical protein